MKNFVKEGEVLTLTAPSGGVVSGTAYKIGQLLVVATATVAQTLPFEGLVEGVVTLPKATGEAWTEGELLYWDDSAKDVAATTGTGLLRIGVAAVAAGTDDDTGVVRLDGYPRPDEA